MEIVEKYKMLMPLAYLIVAALIAIGCHLLKVPEGITGLLIGAALTRVKIPSKDG